MLFLYGWEMSETTTAPAGEIMLGLSEDGYRQLQARALHRQAEYLSAGGEPELAAQLFAGCRAAKDVQPMTYT